MRLISFERAQSIHVGAINREGTSVYDLTQGLPQYASSMLGFIQHGEQAARAAEQFMQNNTANISLKDVRILAPIPTPLRNIICVGKNYRDHLKEVQSIVAPNAVGDEAPEFPIFFTKAAHCVVGPYDAIDASRDPTNSVDYEGELAVVIGRECRQVSEQDALQYIFGYTIVNDVTSRRLQKQHQQWFLGKSLDSFCPMGPSIVTRDEIADASQLRIQTYVNDELRQNGIASDMIFNISTQIASLSRYMTLYPGDILATGTPSGVGMGFKPPKFLRPGDRVKIVIEPIGQLINRVC